jgi:hypothetical protein
MYAPLGVFLYKINLGYYYYYSLLCINVVHMLWRPADSNECCFGYHCRWRASDCCNLQRGSRNKLISHLFYNFIINLRWWPRPTPSEEAPGGGVYSYMETMPLDGKTAHHGGIFLCDFCFTSKKSSEREFLFLPERTSVLSC